MARGPEHSFIDSVHRRLPESVYRMKNHNQYIGGIADCWYSGNKGDLWVEYKFVKVPRRGNTPMDFELTALQKKWLIDRHTEGRSVAVVVGTAAGGVWMPGTTWNQPWLARDFAAAIVPTKQIAETIVTSVNDSLT